MRYDMQNCHNFDQWGLKLSLMSYLRWPTNHWKFCFFLSQQDFSGFTFPPHHHLSPLYPFALIPFCLRHGITYLSKELWFLSVKSVRDQNLSTRGHCGGFIALGSFQWTELKNICAFSGFISTFLILFLWQRISY